MGTGGGSGFIAKSCPTLVIPCTLCTTPGSSVHGISQARKLEWVVTSFSMGSSQPRDRTCVSYIAGRVFTSEPPGEPSMGITCSLSCES